MDLVIKKDQDLKVLSGERVFELSLQLENAREELRNSLEYNIVIDLEEKLKEEQKKIENEKKEIFDKMKEHKVENFTLGNYEFKIKKGRKSKRTMITVEPESLPKKYQKINVEADKTSIKKDLEQGVYIDGCFIEDFQNDDTLEINVLKIK